MKKLMIAAAFVLLTGCASGPKNVGELKAVGYQRSFVVNRGYQQVYRNFVDTFRLCQSKAGLFEYPVPVDSELYTDIGEGRITLRFEQTFGQPTVIQHILIKEQPGNQSELTIYYSDEAAIEDNEPVYRNWANGNLSCE